MENSVYVTIKDESKETVISILSDLKSAFPEHWYDKEPYQNKKVWITVYCINVNTDNLEDVFSVCRNLSIEHQGKVQVHYGPEGESAENFTFDHGEVSTIDYHKEKEKA